MIMSVIKKFIQNFNFLITVFLPLIIKAFFYKLKGYVTLCGFYGIGDNCYQLAFLDFYKNKRGKKIRVVSAKKRQPLFKLYPAIDVVSTISDKKEMALIRRNPKFLKRFFNINSFVVCIYQYVYRIEGTDIISYMRIFYGAELNTRLTYPVVNPSLPITNYDLNEIKNGILIIPQSYSYELSEPIKQSLTTFIDMTKQQYHIFINGDSNIFSGTNIFWDLNTILYYAPFFKLIVGIRTGLMDLLVDSGSNIISLYAKDVEGIDMKEVFCPLTKWNGKSTIKEYYAEDLTRETIESIIGSINNH